MPCCHVATPHATLLHILFIILFSLFAITLVWRSNHNGSEKGETEGETGRCLEDVCSMRAHHACLPLPEICPIPTTHTSLLLSHAMPYNAKIIYNIIITTSVCARKWEHISTREKADCFHKGTECEIQHNGVESFEYAWRIMQRPHICRNGRGLRRNAQTEKEWRGENTSRAGVRAQKMSATETHAHTCFAVTHIHAQMPLTMLGEKGAAWCAKIRWVRAHGDMLMSER